MKTAIVIGAALGLLAVPTGLTAYWVHSASERLELSEVEAEAGPGVAIAQNANAGYCTPELKQILRRVLQSCGLLSTGQVRGCQPVTAAQVASLSGNDFNALFMPMAQRAGVVQFDNDSAALDASDQALIDRLFSDQRGASYFFVVARSSPRGSVARNRELSEERANAVVAHLRQKFNDPDLDREVGLLFLGEEFAQLDSTFCGWQRSGEAGQCSTEELNRSAFVAWIDCQL